MAVGPARDEVRVVAATGEGVIAISCGHSHFPVRAAAGQQAVDAAMLLEKLPMLTQQLEASLRRVRDRELKNQPANR
jgi:hypothetical protein